LVEQVRAAGGSAETVQADLASANGPLALLDRLGRERRTDIRVNNAGVAPFASVADTSPDTFDALAAANMRSLFFVTQQALKQLNDGGRIVNLSSVVTRAAFPGIPAYSATKGFVDVLTLHFAQELAPQRITVNAVAPGAIDTRMSAGCTARAEWTRSSRFRHCRESASRNR
jgi:NAD(P)-dependent dehydrogenase (short-subunit alcohol dehydrogenase family)